MINKKKICGILQEKINKSGSDYLIVGIGFNLIKSPIIPNYPTTNLFEITKKKIKTEIFMNQLKISFGKFLSKYYSTKFSPIQSNKVDCNIVYKPIIL